MGFKEVIIILTSVLLGAFYPALVDSHGYMLEPPNRSSLWRFPEQFGQFNPPENFEDNQLFCGGVEVSPVP